ncbi:tyrosine-type recombinase/integrase [Tunturiibacter psychrotolerans]|uniref:tyrosine-type recombinase/integrase n=1 Tax=Tunturiibacter psychrotolerans TaxID=3069686 RepID=UPI003D20162D
MARKAAWVEGVWERKDAEGKNSGFWYGRFRNNGKLVRKSFGRDRAAAIAWVEKSRTLVRDGEGEAPRSAKQRPRTAAEVKDEAERVLISSLCDGLLERIQKNPDAYKDQKNPPQRLSFIKDTLGDRVASEIRPREIKDWMQEIKRKPGTKNRYKAMLSSVFEFGKERELLSTNPCRDVKPEKVASLPVRWLDDEEETRLRKVIQDQIDACGPRNERKRKHLLHRLYELDVALGTGMRKGEQYSITWDQVYLNRDEIRLDKTKNGSSRIVHMNADVKAAIRGLKKIQMPRKRRSKDMPNPSDTGCIFSVADSKKWFETSVKMANLRHIRWHDLRHTHCSRLAQMGVTQSVIMASAGHKSIQSSVRYIHLDKAAMTAAVNLLNRVL